MRSHSEGRTLSRDPRLRTGTRVLRFRGNSLPTSNNNPTSSSGRFAITSGWGSPIFPIVEIKSVIKAVGLEKAIEERGGLDAMLDDRGRNWSVGQQYRLAFCRALISRRAFLMLDEPFATLDEESIGDVIRTIDLARRSGSGIVLATHILPEDLGADRIIELQRERGVRMEVRLRFAR